MRKTAFFVTVLVLLAAAWSAGWSALSAFAERQADAFIAKEAAQGRIWTCPERAVSGFPFAITLTCREPTYAGTARGQGVKGRVAGLVATLSLAHPTRVALSLAPPFSYRSSDGRTAVGGTWQSLALDLSALPDPRTLALRGTDVSVHGRFPGEDEAGGSAKTFVAAFTASPPSADRTVDFAITMTGAPITLVDELVGGSVPIDASLTGRLDRADPADARTPEEAMERWRQNGGTVTLDAVKIVRGAASAEASGRLGLDEAHRPRGRLDASFVGLGPILQRYGISGNTAAIGALIGTLFGGGHPARPTAPGALSLPIGFRDGRLSIGPITTAVALSPLY